MNILFTTSAAPTVCPFLTKERRPPLGLGFLLSVVRNLGHNVYFIDNYLNPSSFIEEGYLQNNNINFVGINVNTICLRDSKRMLNAIENLRKKGLWQGKLIVGGPHTSVGLDTIPDFVDYIVQGEGEKAIIDIVNNNINSRIIKAERLQNLDTLPFQPWDIFNNLPYDYSCPWIDIKPVFTLNTSRGCPFNCTFCSVGSIWGNKYTCMNTERIISEIKYLVKNYNAKGIYFREDNFTLNIKRTEEFCEALMMNDIDIEWACETRVDNLSESLIALMKRAGCRGLYLGIESGSQRILDLLNKGITIEQIENTLKWCRKYNVRAYCSLIIGLPEETYLDYLTTKKLMRKLKPYSYNFSVFIGIPKSKLYNHIIKNNLYEYIDDIGLAYLPGYDIKMRFFHNRRISEWVDYRFKKRTSYDRKLLRLTYCLDLLRNMRNTFLSIIPVKFRKLLYTISKDNRGFLRKLILNNK